MTPPGAPTGRDSVRIPSDVTAELPRVDAREFSPVDTAGPPPEESDDFRSLPRARRPRPPVARRRDRARPRPTDAGRTGRATRRAIVSADEVAVSPVADPEPAVAAGRDVDGAEVELTAAPRIEDQLARIQMGAPSIAPPPSPPPSPPSPPRTPTRPAARSVPRRSTRRRGRATAISSVLVLAATGIGALLWERGAATVWVIAALPAATAVMIAVFAAVSASLPDA